MRFNLTPCLFYCPFWFYIFLALGNSLYAKFEASKQGNLICWLHSCAPIATVNNVSAGRNFFTNAMNYTTVVYSFYIIPPMLGSIPGAAGAAGSG